MFDEFFFKILIDFVMFYVDLLQYRLLLILKFKGHLWK